MTSDTRTIGKYQAFRTDAKDGVYIRVFKDGQLVELYSDKIESSKVADEYWQNLIKRLELEQIVG